MFGPVILIIVIITILGLVTRMDSGRSIWNEAIPQRGRGPARLLLVPVMTLWLYVGQLSSKIPSRWISHRPNSMKLVPLTVKSFSSAASVLVNLTLNPGSYSSYWKAIAPWCMDSW